jgi:hypothetical protein
MQFLLSNHVLHVGYVDLVGIILLDNMLQCFLFIAMINLSRTYDSTAILICNALVMFMIYP